MRRLTAACLSLLLAVVPAQARAEVDPVERELLARANAVRRAHGQGMLRFEPRLQQAAEDFAAFLARTGRFDHEADGRTAAQRVEAADYPLCLVAENLAWQQSSRGFTVPELAGRLMAGWEASPPHRANLLQPAALDTGIAVVRAPGSTRQVAVQLFGRRWADGVAFQVRNASRRAARYRLDGQDQALPALTTMTHRECVAPRVELPGEAATRVPAAGERYVLQRTDSGWTVRRERFPVDASPGS